MVEADSMTTTDASKPAGCPRRRRKWRQFTVRSLLVIVTLAAVFFSWVAVKVRDARVEREAMEAIEKAGVIAFGPYNAKSPQWLTNLLGEDIIRARVRYVVFSDNATDDDLKPLESLPKINFLALDGSSITDRGLEHIKGLTELMELDIRGTRITDDGLRYLSGMSKLRTLHLEFLPITDAGLEHLKGLKNLEALNLNGTDVTEAGLKDIQKSLPNADDIFWRGHVVRDASP